MWVDIIALIPWGPMLRQFRWVEGDVPSLFMEYFIAGQRLYRRERALQNFVKLGPGGQQTGDLVWS